MTKRKGLCWALLLAVLILIPSLASASIKQVPPKLLPVDGTATHPASRSDFVLKMNNELFEWIEAVFSGVMNYERCGTLTPGTCEDDEVEEVPDDYYLELEEIINEYVFGYWAVTDSTVEPMLAGTFPIIFCLEDIPILGSLCMGIHMRDNDSPSDGAVVSFNDPAAPLGAKEPFGLIIEGDRGATLDYYSDDALRIELTIEEIEVDLVLDEPTDPSLIEFSYPAGNTGTCDNYNAQQWDMKRDGDIATLGYQPWEPHCVGAGDVNGYTRLCQPVTDTVVAGNVWAAEEDFLCDYPSTISATAGGPGVGNSCKVWRQADDNVTPAFDTITGCHGYTDSRGVAWAEGECSFYASTCDLSTWLSINADLTIGWDSDIFGAYSQDIRIGIGIRPIFGGNGTPTRANTAIGFELQNVDFGTNLVFELNTDHLADDHPQAEWSKDIDAILPALDMVMRVWMEDLFKCDTTPPAPGEHSGFQNDPTCVGYYIGATQLLDPLDFLTFLPILHPLIPYITLANYPAIPNLGGEVPEFTDSVLGITPWPATIDSSVASPGAIAAGINLDYGIVSDWMAEQTWGAMMPANLYLDIQMVFMDASTDPPVPFTDPATNYGYIPYPSCVFQYDGRIGDLQEDAYPGRYAPNPVTVTVPNQRPMFCDPPRVPDPGDPNTMILNTDCAAYGMENTTDDLFYSDENGGGPIIFDEEVADRYHIADPFGTGDVHMHFLQGGCDPTLAPGTIVAGGRSACDGGYMLGIGLHQDVISEVVFGLVSSGILCLTIDPTQRTGNSILDLFNGADGASSLLSLSTGNMILGFLLPTLPEVYGNDAPIIVKIVPYTVDPRTRSTTFRHIPRAWTGGAITEVIDNARPATNPNNMFYENTQYEYAIANFPFEKPEIDIQIDIPHMLIEFWTKLCLSDCTLDLPDRTYDVPQRVFALDLGTRMGVDIDILSPMPDPMTFPSGATWEVTETARTFFFGIIVDPNVRMLFSYLEDGVGTYDHTRPCVDTDNAMCPDNPGVSGYNDGSNSVYQANGYNLADLENYMGNLLTTIMSMIAQFEMRLTIDLGARGIGPSLPPIPLTINGSIEPSCNADEVADSVCPRDTNQDPVGYDGYGYGDFLQIYLDVVGDLPTAFIFQFLTCSLLPDDPTCDGFTFSLSALGLAPPGSRGRTDVLFEDPDFDPPKTTIFPVVNPNPFEMVIHFQGYDNDTATERIRYSWRVDNGAWRPFLPLNFATIRGLGDGFHTFEVRAIDDMSYLEPVPAKVSFVIDGVGPDIYLEGDSLTRIETPSPVFFARAHDYVFKRDVDIAYSIDGKDWVATEGEITLSGLADGHHTLNVRAADPKGNVSVASHSFTVDSESGYGCSSTGSSTDLGLLMILLLPSLFFLRRRSLQR